MLVSQHVLGRDPKRSHAIRSLVPIAHKPQHASITLAYIGPEPATSTCEVVDRCWLSSSRHSHSCAARQGKNMSRLQQAGGGNPSHGHPRNHMQALCWPVEYDSAELDL